MKRKITDAAAMEALGAAIAKACPLGARLFLQGELGVGKTTLVRGFLRACGYQGIVKSPTYTLIEPYFINSQTIYHIDLYRINSTAELEAIGLRDYFIDESICLLEWPENAGSYLGDPDLQITIERQNDCRQVSLIAYSPLGERLLNTVS